MDKQSKVKSILKWPLCLTLSFFLGFSFKAYISKENGNLRSKNVLIHSNNNQLLPLNNIEKSKDLQKEILTMDYPKINQNSVSKKKQSEKQIISSNLTSKDVDDNAIQKLDTDIPLGPTIHPTELLENDMIDEYVPQNNVDRDALAMEKEGIPYDDIENMLANPTTENDTDTFAEPEEISLEQREAELFTSWAEAGVSEEDMEAMYHDLIEMGFLNSDNSEDVPDDEPNVE